MTLRARLASVVVAAVALSGCDACGSSALAKLTERSGESVYRDFSNKRTEWEGADVGASFALGDGLRTGDASKALLALADDSQLSVGQNTTIRFLVDGTGENEHGIDIEAGEAVLRAGRSPFLLRTHVGLAQLAPGTLIVLTRDAQSLQLQVDVGEATFRAADGKDQRLGPGERVVLEVGMAIVRAGDANAQPETAGAPAPVPSDGIRANVMHDGVRARERGGEWHALERGEHGLEAGTGLRLPAAMEVEVTRGDERARLLGAGEYVVGDGEALVEALRGDVRFAANGKDVEVRVPGGRIVVRAAGGGSEGAVRIGETEGTLAMTRGSATFRTATGEREVTPGRDYHWAIANEPAPAPADSDVPPPDYSNLEVRAGESFVVHAPEVPVAVTFEFASQCKGGKGLIEIAQPRRRSVGEGSANVLLPAGARSYSLRCLDAKGAPGRVVARGTAHVLADAGTRQLPLRAPTSLVEADGRSYTIYYQNQFPEIRVRWPNPPDVPTYSLDVDGTKMSLKSAEHLFTSGSLRDGVHRVTFEAGQRRSRTTTVDVRFDNTTATASLVAPVDRSFGVGDTVSIEGLALPAWNVSVRGGTIEKVGADRFQGSVVTSAERPDIAVRLVHRRLGTHYYLRRASGSR